MTGKTHQIIGITAGMGWYVSNIDPVYGPATLASLLVGCYFASLLPDIDQPAAKIWHSLPFGHTVSKVINPFLAHRNISHSLLGSLIVFWAIFSLLKLFPDYWGVDKTIVLTAFMISYCSHVLADMFTSEGVPLLFPYQRMLGIPPKPFEGARILTGKWFENLVIFPIINLALIALIVSNWQVLKTVLFK